MIFVFQLLDYPHRNHPREDPDNPGQFIQDPEPPPILNFVGMYEDEEAATPFMGTGGHLIYSGATLTDEGVPKSLKLVGRKVGNAPSTEIEYEDVDSLT